MLSRRRVAVKSWLGSIWAGLKSPQISERSWRDERSPFLLAAEMGGCDSEEEMKLWGCFTGVLLVPGWDPGRSRVGDLGRVAMLEVQRGEFSLAGCVGGVARSVWQDAKLSLAERAAFLLLLLRDLKRLGSCR